MSDKDLVKVKCPRCGNTWFTNIERQKCTRAGCNVVVHKAIDEIERVSRETLREEKS